MSVNDNDTATHTPLLLPKDERQWPVIRPSDEIMAAWDDACVAAHQRGEKPTIHMPHGLLDSRIIALVDQVTGEDVPITWLPVSRFPSELPAQYFNPDLILPEGT